MYQGAISFTLMHGRRGGTSVALARKPRTSHAQRQQLLARSREDRKALSKHKLATHAFLALTLDVGLALADGERGAALDALRAYLRDPPRAPATGTLDQMAARRRLGQLLGGAQGEQLVQEADAQLRKAGAADIERTTEMVLPGTAPSYA